MKVKDKIDGRRVDAVLLVDPWAEVALAIRRLSDALRASGLTCGDE